ncbi:hypothetical protein XI08_11535 [Bradyrhizobium sp. CCBAU 11361]|nr:hypothetical protein [Bradyrhizobium sp. CCBAU 11361]
MAARRHLRGELIGCNARPTAIVPRSSAVAKPRHQCTPSRRRIVGSIDGVSGIMRKIAAFDRTAHATAPTDASCARKRTGVVPVPGLHQKNFRDFKAKSGLVVRSEGGRI